MGTEIQEVCGRLEGYRQRLERIIRLLEGDPNGEIARDAVTLLVSAVDELKRARALVERRLENCEDPSSLETVHAVIVGVQVCAVVRQVFHLVKVLGRLVGKERVWELVGGRTIRDLKELEHLLPPLSGPEVDVLDFPQGEWGRRSVEPVL
ncbi:hypothetical protein [Methanopyrus sp.]